MRKLFIDNDGIIKLAEKIMKYKSSNNNEEQFPDIIAAKEHIIKELNSAKLLRGIESISIPKSGNMRIRTTDLFISNSETGILRKFFIGKWLIEFTADNRIKFYSQNKEELGFHSHIWGDNTVQPHISGRSNTGCLGNSEAGLQAYWQAGSLSGAIMIAIMYLESVNLQDVAGRYLGYCKEVALDDEGNPCYDEQGNYVFISNEFDRAYDNYACRKQVRDCTPNVDTKHNEYITCAMDYCENCDKPFNKWNIIETDTGYYCKDCVDNLKKCEICGKIIVKNKNTGIDNNEHIICNSCLQTHTFTCGMCGKLHIIASPTLDAATRKEISKRSIITNNNIISLCENCINSLNNNDLIRDRVVAKFNKVNCDNLMFINNLVKPKTIMAPISYSYCDIENAIPRLSSIKLDGIYKNNPITFKSSKSFLTDYYNVVRRKDNLTLDILNEYIPIAIIVKDNNIVVYRSSYYNVNSSLILKKELIKDFKDFTLNMETGEIKEIEYTEDTYNNDKEYCTVIAIPSAVYVQQLLLSVYRFQNSILDTEKLINLDINKDKECPICHEKITISIDECPTLKNGEPIHPSCAEIAGARCDNCGRVVQITKLARNNLDRFINKDININWCTECAERNNIVECTRCGTHIYETDAVYLEDMPYCDDCYDEIQ